MVTQPMSLPPPRSRPFFLSFFLSFILPFFIRRPVRRKYTSSLVLHQMSHTVSTRSNSPWQSASDHLLHAFFSIHDPVTRPGGTPKFTTSVVYYFYYYSYSAFPGMHSSDDARKVDFRPSHWISQAGSYLYTLQLVLRVHFTF